MIEVITAKRCTACNTVRPMHMFRIDLCTRDGYKSQCKYCLNARDRARHKRHAEAGKFRSRAPRVVREPLWPLPTQTLAEGLECVRMRKWRGPVESAPLRASL